MNPEDVKRDLYDALAYWLYTVSKEPEKGPKCEDCSTVWGEPYQTLTTEDKKYNFYRCSGCGNETMV